MKLLILADQVNAILNGGMVNTLSGVYCYHFNEAFKRLGIETSLVDVAQFVRDSEEEPYRVLEDMYDFCFIAKNRGTFYLSEAVLAHVRDHVKHEIITICENNSKIGVEDCLVCCMGRKRKRCLFTTWGAEYSILSPKKPEIIRVLVDHVYYGKRMNSIKLSDRTQVILDSLLEYRRAGHLVDIRHISGKGVVEVGDGYQAGKYVQSNAIDFREIYEDYNTSHIYVVTHKESFGLSVIEAAAAGTMIVTPQGYIRNEVISQLHHYDILDTEKIDWGEIFSSIDIEKSIQSSKRFSYDHAATALRTRMLGVLAKE